jgi:hypothetical protein
MHEKKGFIMIATNPTASKLKCVPIVYFARRNAASQPTGESTA